MFFRRYTVLIVLLVIVATFCLGYARILSQKDDWNFEIKTISGDKALLEDVRISGQMIDRYGVVDFSISREDKKSSFKPFYSYLQYAGNKGISTGMGGYKNYYYTDKYSYSMQLGWMNKGLTIYRYKRDSYSRADFIGIPTDVLTSSMTFDSGSNMAEINGRFFFAVPTNETSVGKSGIYEVLKFDNIGYDREDEEQKSYKRLASIPIDSENQVKGLFAVNNKLCLLMSSGESFTLRSFDVDTAAFTGECSFKSEWMIWDAYISGDTLVLLLNNAEVYAFEVNDGVKQIGHLDTYDMNKINGEHVQVSRRYIGFINNRFYILQELLEWPDRKYVYLNAQNEPERVLSLLVYDNTGHQVYYGHIESDIKDDNIRNRQYNEKLLNLEGNERAPYREYVDFKVE